MATWSTTVKNANATLSNGDLTVVSANVASSFSGAGTDQIASGNKFYFEIKYDVASSIAGTSAAGIVNASNTYANGDYLGITTNAYGYFDDGTVIKNNVTIFTYAVYAVNDTIGIAVWGANQLWFAKNNVWQAGDPSALTGGIDITAFGTANPGYTVDGFGAVLSKWTGNFGAVGFTYAPPTGFVGFDWPPQRRVPASSYAVVRASQY